MPEGHQRKKQPEQVRRELLDHARRLAETKGLSGLTLQEVAEAAGVTKGGLLHHFPSKQALIEGSFADGLAQLDEEIDAHISKDGKAEGSFTRAYVKAMLSGATFGKDGAWTALAVSMLMEPTLQVQWAGWLHDRLERHRATDSGKNFEVVRLAADGAWLSHLVKTDHIDFKSLQEQLIDLT